MPHAAERGVTGPAVMGGTEGLAEVRAHDQVIRYRRSGAGAAVLLLDSHDELWPELAGALARHFRLMVPELPADAAQVSGLLRCLLDGLGGFDVAVVASGRYCDAALALALGRNEFVGRVVLVPDAEGAWSEVPEAREVREAREVPELRPDEQRPAVAETVPLFVLPRRLPAALALERTLRFLGVSEDGAAG